MALSLFALTGQQSDIAPMIATLTVVAAFDPVRNRVTRFVDARFKYPTPTKRVWRRWPRWSRPPST